MDHAFHLLTHSTVSHGAQPRDCGCIGESGRAAIAAWTFDHGKFEALLRAHVVKGLVDHGVLRSIRNIDRTGGFIKAYGRGRRNSLWSSETT